MLYDLTSAYLSSSFPIALKSPVIPSHLLLPKHGYQNTSVHMQLSFILSYSWYFAMPTKVSFSFKIYSDMTCLQFSSLTSSSNTFLLLTLISIHSGTPVFPPYMQCSQPLVFPSCLLSFFSWLIPYSDLDDISFERTCWPISPV